MGVNPETIRDVRASFDRAMANNPRFFEEFYLVLFSKKDEYAHMFGDVDMVHQYARLYGGVLKLIEYAENPRVESLQMIGSIHSHRHTDVRPMHYLDWTSTLLAVLSKSDSEFNPILSESWVAVLTPGIEYLKSVY